MVFLFSVLLPLASVPTLPEISTLVTCEVAVGVPIASGVASRSI